MTLNTDEVTLLPPSANILLMILDLTIQTSEICIAGFLHITEPNKPRFVGKYAQSTSSAITNANARKSQSRKMVQDFSPTSVQQKKVRLF